MPQSIKYVIRIIGDSLSEYRRRTPVWRCTANRTGSPACRPAKARRLLAHIASGAYLHKNCVPPVRRSRQNRSFHQATLPRLPRVLHSCLIREIRVLWPTRAIDTALNSATMKVFRIGTLSSAATTAPPLCIPSGQSRQGDSFAGRYFRGRQPDFSFPRLVCVTR